jgi:hypothetical protein
MPAKKTPKKVSKSASKNMPVKRKSTPAKVSHISSDPALTQRRLAAGLQFKSWPDPLFAIYEPMAES